MASQLGGKENELCLGHLFQDLLLAEQAVLSLKKAAWSFIGVVVSWINITLDQRRELPERTLQ